MSAPSTEEVVDTDYDVPELGDILTLKSSVLGTLTGKIVYRDEHVVRIQTFVASDRAQDVQMAEDGDFATEMGVTETIFHAKRVDPHFAIQLGVSVGELLEFYTNAGEKAAESGIVSEIIADDANDAIMLSDGRRLNFAFIGPPAPIGVVGVRSAEMGEAAAAATAAAATAAEGEPQTDETTLPDEFDISALAGLLPAAMVEDVPTAEQTYDDSIQREDMFIDLLKDYKEAKHKNPYLIRRLARETELLIALKHAVTTKGPDGSNRPFVKSAANFEDLLKNSPAALASLIPVFAAKRILYEDGTLGLEPPSAEIQEQVEFRDWLVSELVNYRTSQAYLAGQENGGAAQVSKLMYAYLYDVLYREGNVFVPTGSAIEGQEVTVDQEALRTVVPPDTLLGYSKGTVLYNHNSVGPIKLRQHRFLSNYKSRSGEVIAPGDPGTADSYLLLPTQIGSTYRPLKFSGALAEDIRAADITTQIGTLETVTNKATAYNPNGIVVLKGSVATSDGDEPSSVTVSEFLERNLQSNVHPSDLLGPSAVGVNRVIDSIGLRSYEWTPEVGTVIWNAVTAAQQTYTAAYDAYIARSNEAIENGGYKLKSLVPDDSPVFMKALEVPELAAVLSQLKADDHVKGEWDLAQLQTIVSTAEQTLLGVLYLSLAAEPHPHLKRTREVYLAEVERSRLVFARLNGELAKYKAEPIINTCPHMKDKDALRSVMMYDESKFYALLQVFLKRYQGKRDSANANWVMCNVCDTHLICSHELMKFYEVLHPGRAEALHKEVVLNFGGAAFNGRYICRNCGIPISEFEYDTHLEYDDEGRPLVGRAVISDEEKTAEDELDSILNISLKKKSIEFENPIQSELYEIARVIVQNTGFSFTEEEYRRTVDFTYSYITTTLPPKDVYEQMTAKRKVKQPYESFRVTTEVACIAAYIICNIHSTVPLADVLFPFGGCRFQRGGPPIEPAGAIEGGGAAEYFVCVIANLNRTTEPWNMLAWATESSPDRRQNMVRERLMKLFGEPELRIELQKAQVNYQTVKRDTIGNASAGDRVPGGFRPTPSNKPPISDGEALTNPDRVLQSASELPVETISPVVESRNHQLAIQSVISAHALAKANSVINESSVRSDSNCCFVSLGQAKQQGLATFNEAATEREITSLRFAEEILNRRDPSEPANGSHLYVRWSPPEAIASLPVAPDTSYFKLFMRTCFKGPRVGLSHEFGRRGNRYECRHCNFNLGRNPLVLAADLNDEEAESKRKGKPIVVVQEEAREALKANGVTVDADSFTQLLSIVRKTRYVNPAVELANMTAQEIFGRLERLIAEDSPLVASRLGNWALVQQAMVANFARQSEPSEEARKITWAGFVSKYDTLRDGLLDLFDGRQGRAPVRQMERRSLAIFQAIDAITGEPIHVGPAEVNKHWVIGLERLAQGFNEMIFGAGTWFGQTLNGPKSLVARNFNGTKWFGKKISERHSEKFAAMIQTIMGANTDTNKELSAPAIRAGATELLHRLSTYIGRIVGFWSEQMVLFKVYGVSIEELQALLRWIVLASIESLLLIESPLYSKIPRDADKIKIQMILASWTRSTFLEARRQFDQFGMTDDDVQLAIEDAREKEKNSVIKELDDEKDPDLRALIKINMGLKIGRWAIGSAKNLTNYNAEFYDFLQDQRDRAGIVDRAAARDDPLGFDFGAQPQSDAKYDTYAREDEDYDE